MVYECAARIDNTALMKHANEYGNINVRGLFCSDQDFLVSMAELADVRSGTMSFETIYHPYDSLGTLMAFFVATAGTLLLAGVCFGALLITRWIGAEW
ncbi:hypothetical protein [Rhizobium giardinii]|uniref:Uncharacterized protein n=1 Tax=Rhizobium giardinii TaxID=56731 RepID=A0A7W8UJV6_9HYPH|nr:hypothetical protein [Rhizobium giardinii]MBB5539535.1 hypothetical protein [Rhizobium giardinii]